MFVRGHPSTILHRVLHAPLGATPHRIPHDPLPRPLQLPAERLLRSILLPSMDDRRQPLQLDQQSLALHSVLLVRMLHQKLHIPDQMGQAKLHQTPGILHVLAVGAEEVTSGGVLPSARSRFLASFSYVGLQLPPARLRSSATRTSALSVALRHDGRKLQQSSAATRSNFWGWDGVQAGSVTLPASEYLEAAPAFTGWGLPLDWEGGTGPAIGRQEPRGCPHGESPVPVRDTLSGDVARRGWPRPT